MIGPRIMGSHKVENDPWVPLDQELDVSRLKNSNETTVSDLPLPKNPLYHMIDSEKYIQTLEQKLAKITKNRNKQKEPTSRDIINSLADFHEDQMRRYLDDTAGICSTSDSVAVDDSSMQPSYLQRKIYPERQPLNSEEIAELLKEDVLGEKFEELNGSNTDLNTCAGLVRTSIGKSKDKTQEKPENVSENMPAAEKSDLFQNNGASKEGSESNSNNSENWANFDNINGGNGKDL